MNQKYPSHFTLPLLILYLILITACKQFQPVDDKITVESVNNDKFSDTYLIYEDSTVFYGESIYVPIYSEVFYDDDKKTLNLSATLSIHNTDPGHDLTVKSIAYHNTKGELIRQFIVKPIYLKPLETVNYVVPEKDKTGGSGANFIIVWYTDSEMSSPLIEALMLTTQMNQGISFMTQGKIIQKFGNSIEK